MRRPARPGLPPLARGGAVLPLLATLAVTVLACSPQQAPPLRNIPSLAPVVPTPSGLSQGLPGVQDPRGLTIDAAGNAWLVNGTGGSVPAGRVLKYTSARALAGTFELGAEGGPAAADASGSLWTLSSSPSLRLFRISSEGTIGSYPLAGGGYEPRGLAVDAEGHVWFSEASRSVLVRCTDGLPDREVPLGTDTLGQPARPWGLVASTASLWIASRGARMLSRYELTSGTLATFSLAVEATGAVALDTNGFVYAGTRFAPGTTRSILKLQPTGTVVRDYEFSQSEPTMLVGDTRGYLWGLDRLASRVIRLTPATGEMLLYANQDVVRPTLIATDPQGNAWVASPTTPGSTGSLFVVPAER